MTTHLLSHLRRLVLDEATQRQRRVVYGAVAALGVVLWILHARSPIVFPVDDAYITAHNAGAIAGGEDPNFGVSGLVGATSPLHTLLVALFALVLPSTVALYIVMWLAAIAYALGVVRLAFAFRASVGQAVLVLLASTLVAEVPHILMNGLETGLAMAAMVWTLALVTEGTKVARVAAAMCGVLPLLRPELAVVSGLMFLVLAVRRWRAAAAWRAAVRPILVDAAAALAVVLPFAIILWIATGAPVPSTLSAKRYYFAEACLPEPLRRAALTYHVKDFVGLLNVASAAVVLLLVTAVGRALVVFACVFVLAYYLQFPTALGHYEHRYMYVLLPPLVFGVASCLRDHRRSLRWLATTIVVGTVLLSAYMAPAAWRRHNRFALFTTHQLGAVSDWAVAHISRGSKLLVHDVGYIAHATDFPLVDMVGLKTPASTALHEKITWRTCGRYRREAIHQIAVATRPDYIVMQPIWNSSLRLTEWLAQRGWQLELVRPVVDTYEFEVYRIRPPAIER